MIKKIWNFLKKIIEDEGNSTAGYYGDANLPDCKKAKSQKKDKKL